MSLDTIFDGYRHSYWAIHLDCCAFKVPNASKIFSSHASQLPAQLIMRFPMSPFLTLAQSRPYFICVQVTRRARDAVCLTQSIKIKLTFLSRSALILVRRNNKQWINASVSCELCCVRSHRFRLSAVLCHHAHTHTFDVCSRFIIIIVGYCHRAQPIVARPICAAQWTSICTWPRRINEQTVRQMQTKWFLHGNSMVIAQTNPAVIPCICNN